MTSHSYNSCACHVNQQSVVVHILYYKNVVLSKRKTVLSTCPLATMTHIYRINNAIFKLTFSETSELNSTSSSPE